MFVSVFMAFHPKFCLCLHSPLCEGILELYQTDRHGRGCFPIAFVASKSMGIRSPSTLGLKSKHIKNKDGMMLSAPGTLSLVVETLCVDLQQTLPAVMVSKRVRRCVQKTLMLKCKL